jgi:hypothetical protein
MVSFLADFQPFSSRPPFSISPAAGGGLQDPVQIVLDDGLDLPEDRGKNLDPQPLQAGPVFVTNPPADNFLNPELPEIKDLFIRRPMADIQLAAFRQLRPLYPQD